MQMRTHLTLTSIEEALCHIPRKRIWDAYDCWLIITLCRLLFIQAHSQNRRSSQERKETVGGGPISIRLIFTRLYSERIHIRTKE